MDFFEHQERAKKKTGVLVFLFGVAVTLIVLAVYGVIALNFRISPPLDAEHWGSTGLWKYWDAQLFVWVAGATLLLILSGTLYKIKTLSELGGEGVASMFEGSYLQPGTTRTEERRLLNIVEEMSIAAGIAVPRVYLMESDGINAFAAGFSVNSAVLGVTRGSINKLTRQELQGVIAHEFSHIINGDMTSNLRLVGLLHGILLLNIIGYTLIRAARRGRGKGRAAFFLFGLALAIIGYVGVFFGRLIKAAFSRQREFLADATAVQYTRDPEGIHGALKKISLSQHGSYVDNPAAEEVAHLFFGNALSSGGAGQLFGLLATHPPLHKRMERILPQGTKPRAVERPTVERVEHSADFWRKNEDADFTGNFIHSSGREPATTIQRDFLEVGELNRSGLEGAGDWMNSLPPPIQENRKSPQGAASILLALLMTRMPVTGRVSGAQILHNIPEEIWTNAQDLGVMTEKLDAKDILPLVDLALGSLKDLPRKDLKAIHDRTFSFDGLRGRETLFDYMISSFIRARLWEMVEPSSFSDPRGGDVLRYTGPIRVALSTIARHGHPENDQEAEISYKRAIETLGKQHFPSKSRTTWRRLSESNLLPSSECDLKEFDGALFSLKDAAPMLQKSFLEACHTCICRDDTLRPEEIELFRAVAGVLNCPVPPRLNGIAA